MKVRSIVELEDIIAKEYAWRRKELTNIKQLSLTAKKYNQELLFKSGITVLYSHWEGFVKQASIVFCEYINHQGIAYHDLNHNFHVCAVINYFQGQYPHRNYKSIFSVINKSSIDLSQSFRIDAEKYIDTKSNLNSDVLQEITMKVGLDYSLYELKGNLIDERFLKLRNAISHGEYRRIDEKDFLELFDEIIILIDTYKNQILNAAVRQEYLMKPKLS